MAGITNFPGSLDTDSQLFDVTDAVSSIQAAHHNNMKESIKAIQAKIGVTNTGVATALDYRLGHPTNSHRHDGASGQGRQVEASYISGLSDFIADATAGGGGGAATKFFVDHPSLADRMVLTPSYAVIEGRGAHATFQPHLAFATANAELRAGTGAFFRVYPTGILIAPPSPNINNGNIYLYRSGGPTNVWAGVVAHQYIEFAVNTYAPGGPRDAKIWMFGGWGLVLPGLATSGIIPTYSSAGQVYYDEASDKLRAYAGGTWRALAFE